MNKASLLVELGTEELPPKSLKTLKDALGTLLSKALLDRQFEHGRVTTFGTPRRLSVLVEACSDTQPEQFIERRGPSLKAAYGEDNLPTKALRGFLNACGTDNAEDLERLETEKGVWLVYRAHHPGATLASEFQAVLDEAVSGLPIAKRMRWGNLRLEFVRPLRWLVALHDKDILECSLFGQQAGRTSQGHRALYDGDLIIENPEDYVAALQSANVIASFEARRDLIQTQLNQAAESRGGALTDDPELLDEVTALTEWPVVLGGEFDPSFLEVPEEALISAMREHQRYFHLRGPQDALEPCFLTVANLESSDPDLIIKGNERVIRPRLADAQFFFRRDLKRPILDAASQLNQVIFQNELGSFGDKANRIGQLASFIANQIGEDALTAERAGRLAKTDLVSQMVGEFPDLQGTMGRYYALAQGEDVVIADTIRDHYLPRFSGDRLPDNAIACAVALADRIDTLVGLFGIGQPPTGSKDPFALRRQALAIVRICIDYPIQISMNETLMKSAELHAGDYPVEPVRNYLLDRFENLMADQGVALDNIRAIRGRSGGIDDLTAAVADIASIAVFRTTEAGLKVINTQKRVRNIVEKSDQSATDAIQTELFKEDAEFALLKTIERLDAALSADFPEQLALVSSSAEPVVSYFESVMVMDDDPLIRENRLNTLRALNQALTQIAAFDALQQ